LLPAASTLFSRYRRFRFLIFRAHRFSKKNAREIPGQIRTTPAPGKPFNQSFPLF
jgi:hypothetical protein